MPPCVSIIVFATLRPSPFPPDLVVNNVENTFFRLGSYNVRKKGKTKLDSKFEEKVALVKFYPGQDPEILDYYLKKGYKGIVIEMGALDRKSVV